MLSLKKRKNGIGTNITLDYAETENNYDDIEDDSFDVDLLVQNISNFNSAVNTQNIDLIMHSLDIIIIQMVDNQNSVSDPDLIPYFDTSKFYLNCIKCLNANHDDLIIKIIYMIGLFANLSTDVADSLLKDQVLSTILSFMLNRSFSPQLLTKFLYFIKHISLPSFLARKLMIQMGILNFFSNIVKEKTSVQILMEYLSCIRDFLKNEDFEDISYLPQLDELMITLNQCFIELFPIQFNIETDDINRYDICLTIISIYNIYIGVGNNTRDNLNETCSHFLQLPIPSSLIQTIDDPTKSIVGNSIVYLIMCNLDQLFMYGNPDLLLAFAQNINIILFTKFYESDILEISDISLCIIEHLLKFKLDNISILAQINFYHQIITIFDDAPFKIQAHIINIITLAIINSTSSEILCIFLNENVINILIDSIGISTETYDQLIPHALLKMKDLIAPNNSIFIEIENALENVLIPKI